MRLIVTLAIVIAVIGTSVSTATADGVRQPAPDTATVDVGQGRQNAAHVHANGEYGEYEPPTDGYSAPAKKHYSGPVVVAPPPCDPLDAGSGDWSVDTCWNFPLDPTIGTPRTGTPATPDDARQYALEYIRSIELPTPAPQISAPRGGICGVVHSLDLHIADANPAYMDPETAFGPLLVRFHGRFTVDWGDHTKTTYTTTGAPYPRSAISHTWTDRGYYDINVVANWSAEWSFGQYSGAMSGFRTTGGITQWRVWEAQAMLVS